MMNRTKRATLTVCVLAAATMAAGGALAQTWQGPRSDFNSVDVVTGYRCVTPGCDTLRMPNTRCICQKQNPGERDLSKLRLVCSTTKNGQWVSCPVQPPFGN